MSLSAELSNLLEASNRRIKQAEEVLKKQEEEERKKGGRKSGSNFKGLEKEWKAEMDRYDELIEYAQNIGDYESLFSYYAQAQNRADEIAGYYVSRGFAEDSAQVLSWRNTGYDYAAASDKAYDRLFGGLTDSIEDLISALDTASALQEKTLALQEAEYSLASAREAVDTAGEGLENARNQRKIRVWNEQTDSWDFIADAAAVSSAEELLQKREEELRKAENSFARAENALAKLNLTSQLEAFEASGGTVLGPDLASLIASAIREGEQGNTQQQNISYYFQNGITIGSDEAKSMTLAELAKLLGSLEVY